MVGLGVRDSQTSLAASKIISISISIRSRRRRRIIPLEISVYQIEPLPLLLPLPLRVVMSLCRPFSVAASSPGAGQPCDSAHAEARHAHGLSPALLEQG